MDLVKYRELGDAEWCLLIQSLIQQVYVYRETSCVTSQQWIQEIWFFLVYCNNLKAVSCNTLQIKLKLQMTLPRLSPALHEFSSVTPEYNDQDGLSEENILEEKRCRRGQTKVKEKKSDVGRAVSFVKKGYHRRCDE